MLFVFLPNVCKPDMLPDVLNKICLSVWVWVWVMSNTQVKYSLL